MAAVSRWAIHLNDTHPAAQGPVQMVILDADQSTPLSAWPASCLRLAYLSVGEAEDRRPYWTRIAGAAYLHEQDKESEGNVRVDFRDPQWQSLLLKEEIPRILAKGYQGFLLDQLDSIFYLEAKDPETYAGNRDALKAWLADLRRAYPDLILLAGGSQSLDVAAPHVDGYLLDGVFTVWDPAGRRVRATTREERDERLDFLDNAMAIAPHPVFTVEYGDAQNPALIESTLAESRKRRFHTAIQRK